MKAYFNQLIVCLFLLSGIMAGCTSISRQEQEQEEEPDRPNFVIVFTDELEMNDVGPYGGKFPTPNLDKLASEGLRFTRAYTPSSMCTPARFAFLTGLYPGRCVAPTFLESNPKDQPYSIAWNTWITSDLMTLPRLMSQNGYLTGMAGKWHVGHMGDKAVPQLNLDDDPNDPEIDQKLATLHAAYVDNVQTQGGFDVAQSVLWSNFDNHPLDALRFHNFPWISRGALSFLEQASQANQPFLLYVAPTAIHGPNHVRDLEYDKRFTLQGIQDDVPQYDLDTAVLRNVLDSLEDGKSHRCAGIVNIDHQLGLIRSKLEEMGQADNTIIIFLADHNIEPGKATSFEKGTNIPMIIHWPGKTDSAVVTQSLVASLDVFPTILDIARIEVPQDLNLDGVSFTELFLDPKASPRKYVFAENGYSRAVSDGRMKYIALRYPESDITRMEQDEIEYVPSYVGNWPQAHSAIAMKCFPHYFDQNQLYDLQKDRYEQANIYNQEGNYQVALDLKKALQEHLSSFEHPFDLDDIEYLKSEDYMEKYQTNLDYDLRNIPWFRRDHGRFDWPPEVDDD